MTHQNRIERAVAYAEIVELLARYATIIDTREWESLGQIFAPDGTFDATSIGTPLMDGLEQIKHHMATSARHPAAHLILNVVADVHGDQASASSRLAAVQQDGRLFTATYRDELNYTVAGWRIQSRIYARLQEPSDPALPRSLTLDD